MLISFSMENTFSFKNKVTLDMKASAIKAHRYSILEFDHCNLLPVIAIYGANASGKTNLIKGVENALSAISGNMANANSFLLGNTDISDMVCKWELRFFVNPIMDSVLNELAECKFVIHMEGNSKKYIKEELSLSLPSKNSLQTIYTRNWNAVTGKWLLTTGTSSIAKKVKKEIIYVNDMENNQDCLLITVLGKRANCTLFKNILIWASKNVFYCEPFNMPSGVSLIEETNDLLCFYKNKNNLNELSLFIHSINPVINNFVLHKIDDPNNINNEKYITTFIYNISGSNIFSKNLNLSFNESKGVWTALYLYPKIYNALQNGGIIVIDELENSLHPLLMAKIINMFTSPETNPGKGQLIFTTHNVLLMDKKYFRQDEIVFVEKNIANGESTIYRLSDIDGVRSDLDFCKNYIYGAFGALPDFSNSEESVSI